MAAVRLYQRPWVLIRLPIALIALAAMASLWWLWLPMPPSEITISSGRSDGAYFAHARRYADKFAEHGVTLKVLESDGAVENLQRLRADVGPRIDLGFVQGGVGSPGDYREGARVLTLARVDIEPVWIISRSAGVDSLQQLQGLRVSLGPRGSGTRQLALALLDQVRLGPRDVIDSQLSGLKAADALIQGNLDAIITVMSPQAPAILTMLQAPGLNLVQLRRSAALMERLPYLQPRLLPQGAMDTAGRVPARDSMLMVTTSSLLARSDLHPALQRLATQVAREVHSGPGLFQRAGEFPSLKRIEFPASEQARRTLIHGLPLLEGNLPFWWAQVALRLLVIGVPVALLACSLAWLVPAYLRWILEMRVIRWYGELKYIEHEIAHEALSGMDLSRHIKRLNGIEKKMNELFTAADLMPRWFTLRHHVTFVRGTLARRRGR